MGLTPHARQFIQAKEARSRNVPRIEPKKPTYLGTGRRKTAVARVRLTEGSGQITINDRPFDQYFTETKDHNAVTGPLELTEMRNRVDLVIRVEGGGFSGQAGAVCQGIARALKQYFGITTASEADGEEG